MAIYATQTKPEYSIPDGSYPAILFQIIQLGSQQFGKDTPKPWYSPQILLGFELPGLTYETQNGEVSSIKSGTYFLSMNESRNGMVGLREIVDGLRGSAEYTKEQLEKFDISEFLGKECVIVLSGVESKGKVYQNIVAVGPCDFAKEGYGDLKPMRNPKIVETEDFANIEILALPTWIEDKIKASKEYQEMMEEPKDIQVEDENKPPVENNAFAGAAMPSKPITKPAEEEMPDDFLL